MKPATIIHDVDAYLAGRPQPALTENQIAGRVDARMASLNYKYECGRMDRAAYRAAASAIAAWAAAARGV
jgi:hypothetical protein